MFSHLCPHYWDTARETARKFSRSISKRDQGLFKSRRKQEPIKKLNWVISPSMVRQQQRKP